MNRKIKSLITIIMIVVMMTLSACGSRYINKHNIKTSYKEWINQISLFSHENLKVQGYTEKDNKIELDLEYENGLTGYKELCDVVNAHNKFVSENPDYFSSDINIRIMNRYASEMTASFFFSNSDDLMGINEYIEELGRAKSSKIQYMYIDPFVADAEISNSDNIEIDVPVVIMQSDYEPGEEKYAFLNEFKNAEQVIIDYHKVEYNQEKACEYIRKYLPDVEIYSVVVVDNECHLEKCP